MIDFRDPKSFDGAGKKITIMGLGLLGRGLGDTLFLAKEGADLIVTDLKTARELKPSLDKLKKFKNIKYTLGKHKIEDFKGRDIILRGPSVPKDSKYLKVARGEGTPVEMDDSLFAKHCPAKIIGVTGTKGKTTVATWIYDGLNQHSKKKVYLAGNVLGVATLPLIEKVKKDDLVVLELSSWQLQGWDEAKISPHIAVITNIYPDHMNYYKGDMGAYVNDKKAIYKHQTARDYLIVNKKSKYFKDLKKEAKSGVYGFDLPEIKDALKFDYVGRHDLENLAAAGLVLEILKFKLKQEFVSRLKRVENRLELILEDKKAGVHYINDTTATTPIATQKALEALTSPQPPSNYTFANKIILIAGGSDKGLDFKDLALDIKKKCKSLVLLKGDATEKLKKELTKINYEKIVGEYSNLTQAVKRAKSLAKKGDVILFSPACTSFGMFINEYDRGDKFKKIVKSL
ncbi:UDP-N-acetylmuramoyl-L-alanine--D-glutamate ligase [Candidatus Falkowbacteria bacterium]|nr:UDP-N-acetylmuramoyl-L-alanine--D-glutamate ligase [Candidatus Falkowbacteria bacterium]